MMTVLKTRKAINVLQGVVLGAGLCTSCREDTPLATYPNRVLEGKIREYTDSAKGQGDKRKVLTLDCSTTGDTVTFELANTFPDSTEATLLGYDRISGFTVFFIGSARKDYVRVNTSPREAARQLRGRILAEYGPGPMPGLNFKTYVYRFVNNRLVN